MTRKVYNYKLSIIAGLLFMSGWSFLWGFQDIKMEVRGSTEEKAISKLNAKLIEEFSRQVAEQKSLLFSDYGLIWQKSGQDISYSHYKDIFKIVIRLDVNGEDSSLAAVFDMDAQTLREKCAKVSKVHYEKAMQYYHEFESYSLQPSRFTHYQHLIFQAADEMISCIELNQEEQSNAMIVFQTLEHFLRQFTFIAPESHIVAEGIDPANSRYGFALYFNNETQKIPLVNVPVSVEYAGKTVRYQTDQNGFCEIKKLDSKLIRYQIHTDQLFNTSSLKNSLFLNQFIKQYMNETRGDFKIETVKKPRLIIRSDEFTNEELNFLSGYYNKKGYVLTHQSNPDVNILKVSLKIEEDKPLYIGGYYMKGYIQVQIINTNGVVVESLNTATKESISPKDRTHVKKNLRNMLLKELRKHYIS